MCITSGINIEFSETVIADCFTLDDVPDVGVICKTAQGKKCQRCWTLNISVDKSDNDLCERCHQAVNLSS